MTGFAVLDLETTGVRYRTDRVLEVGVIQLDGDLRETLRWATLVNPERAVTAEDIHGISATDVHAAPCLADVAEDLMALLTGRVLVAHNAVFDVNHLMLGLERAGVPLPERLPAVVDTMRLCSRVAGARSLAQACEVLSIDLASAHEALSDAEATAEVLRRTVNLDRDALPGATASYSRHTDTGHWRGGPAVALSLADDPVVAVARTGAALTWPALGDAVPTPRLGYTRQAAENTRRHDTGYLARLVSRLPVVDDDPDSDSGPYLTLLDEALDDRLITHIEADSLVAAAQELGLSQFEIARANVAYMDALAAAAWADGIVTDQERTDLLAVATLLGLPAAAVANALDVARDHSEQRRTSARRIAAKPGDRVVFTGAMSRPRCDLAAQAQRAGLVPTTSISAKTGILVIADPHSQSGKARRARDLGVRLVSEPVFNEICTDLTCPPSDTEAVST